MVKFQLRHRNEYGEVAIIDTSSDLDAMMERGKKEVSSENIDNALTAEEKRKNWTVYFAELESDSGKYVYAGLDGHGDHVCYEIKSDEDIVLSPMKNFSGKVKIYLGFLDREEWYASNAHKNAIDKVDAFELNDKDFYFISKI
jgi:hypothetical protein